MSSPDGTSGSRQPPTTSRLAPTPRLPPLMGQGSPSPATSPRARSSSHSSHSSDSSHSSHSSVQARKREEAFGTSAIPSVAKPAWSLLSILAIIAACHGAALYLFTSGFLLTRTEITGVSECGVQTAQVIEVPTADASADSLLAWGEQHSQQCSLAPAFDRTLVLIIDALRYDFIASNASGDAFHHGHFDFPASTAAQQPQDSVLAHFLSDAPTTTLQRLKGLTTGSLPTFIDAGSNFGAEAIREDNWVSQLRKSLLANSDNNDGAVAGMGYIGDDTWLKVYPDLFDANWTWPFDSFNVEDLHTVDEGVERHLMPFLRGDESSASASATTALSSWRLLVAHTLGLDHVGHRHTPHHPLMTAKLQQMNRFVQDIVQRLPPRTLFVLAGDHGMDSQGDHGGEGELEVGAALWMYAKDGFAPGGGGGESSSQEDMEAFRHDVVALQSDDATAPLHLFGPESHRTFSPLGPVDLHRSIPQVDLVPSISLLLGVPIPFGNLGTIIPDAFPPAGDSSRLLSALRINARQLRRFLQEYSSVSNDFTAFAPELEQQYLLALRKDAAAADARRTSPSSSYYTLRREAMVEYQRYNRLALNRARSLWTSFNHAKIVLGLAGLLMSILATWNIVRVARRHEPVGTAALAKHLHTAFGKGCVGAFVVASAVKLAVSRVSSPHPLISALQSLTWVSCFLAATTLGGLLALLGVSSPADAPSLAQQVKAGYESKASTAVATKKGNGNVKRAKSDASAAAASETPTTSSSSTSSSPSALSDLLSLSPVMLHAALFTSNSLTVWEDAIVHALLAVVLLWRAWSGWSLGSQLLQREITPVGGTQPAPTENVRAIAQRARQRIPFLLGVSVVLLRCIKVIGVCREEQAPSCTTGFFHLEPLSSLLALDNGSLSVVLAHWLPTLAVLATCYASSYILPHLLLRSLRQSKSDTHLVKFWADWIFRPTLMLGSGWWVIDWIGEALAMSQESSNVSSASGNGAKGVIQWGKNTIARVDFTLVLVVGLAVWFFAPLCLEVKEETQTRPPAATSSSSSTAAPPSPPMTAADQQAASQKRVELLGFSNVFGSSYLLFMTVLFSLVWVVSPPAAQLSLGALFVVILSLAEAGDAERDLLALSRLAVNPQARPSTLLTRTPSLLEITTLHLLAHALFFSTGHQATFLSIQWRTAFVGFSTVTYPWAPLLVILNTFGPSLLLGTAVVPLLLSWNLPPTPRGPTSRPMKSFRSLLLASLYLLLITSIVTFASALFATHFRRHLMLFKIWAPRYMTAAVALLGVDAVLILAAAAWSLIASKVAQSLGTEFE